MNSDVCTLGREDAVTAGSLATSVCPVPVPHAKQIRDLLGNLTARDVGVGVADPVIPGRDSAAVAVYVTDRLATGAVVACDLPLAAATAAALGLVPVPQMEEALAAGRLPDDLTENLHEVANVLSSVFNQAPGAPHLRLYKVHAAGEKLPTDVAAMLGYVVRRLDLKVDIAGYGGGRLSVVAIG